MFNNMRKRLDNGGLFEQLLHRGLQGDDIDNSTPRMSITPEQDDPLRKILLNRILSGEPAPTDRVLHANPFLMGGGSGLYGPTVKGRNALGIRYIPPMEGGLVQDFPVTTEPVQNIPPPVLNPSVGRPFSPDLSIQMPINTPPPDSWWDQFGGKAKVDEERANVKNPPIIY